MYVYIYICISSPPNEKTTSVDTIFELEFAGNLHLFT